MYWLYWWLHISFVHIAVSCHSLYKSTFRFLNLHLSPIREIKSHVKTTELVTKRLAPSCWLMDSWFCNSPIVPFICFRDSQLCSCWASNCAWKLQQIQSTKCRRFSILPNCIHFFTYFSAFWRSNVWFGFDGFCSNSTKAECRKDMSILRRNLYWWSVNNVNTCLSCSLNMGYICLFPNRRVL